MYDKLRNPINDEGNVERWEMKIKKFSILIQLERVFHFKWWALLLGTLNCSLFRNFKRDVRRGSRMIALQDTTLFPSVPSWLRRSHGREAEKDERMLVNSISIQSPPHIRRDVLCSLFSHLLHREQFKTDKRARESFHRLSQTRRWWQAATTIEEKTFKQNNNRRNSWVWRIIQTTFEQFLTLLFLKNSCNGRRMIRVRCHQMGTEYDRINAECPACHRCCCLLRVTFWSHWTLSLSLNRRQNIEFDCLRNRPELIVLLSDMGIWKMVGNFSCFTFHIWLVFRPDRKIGSHIYDEHDRSGKIKSENRCELEFGPLWLVTCMTRGLDKRRFLSMYRLIIDLRIHQRHS